MFLVDRFLSNDDVALGTVNRRTRLGEYGAYHALYAMREVAQTLVVKEQINAPIPNGSSNEVSNPSPKGRQA